MKKVSLKRASVCFLLLLSFVGACLSQLTASAQERVGQKSQVQESQVQDRDTKTDDAQELKAEKRKAKRDKRKIRPTAICMDCDPGGGGGGGGGGGTYTGDGHVWCDGWNRQGDCAFNHVSAVGSADFRRKLGNNGYDFQCFLTWFPAEVNDTTPGRFPIQDGSVGLVSTSPLPGQVALHRWSTRKGFYYSIFNTSHASDYIYGGVAAYVWPPGDSRGFPLFQFYSQEYGHYYTNYKREIGCQPRNVTWADQGEMARVNFPAPFAQTLRNCNSLVFPVACDPFARFRCEARGQFFNPGNCLCSDGLP
jgi:hypothetical protein